MSVLDSASSGVRGSGEGSHLLLSQNLMTLFWLLLSCVFMMRSNSECDFSCPSTTSRPLKNQWRLCSLQDAEDGYYRESLKETVTAKHEMRTC